MALSLALWIIIIVVIVILWFIFSYNSFVRLRNRADNAWSQIDVQLKRRFDLIPNLIETVKGYMKHEKDTLKEITEARTSFMHAKNPKDMAKADNMLSGALKTIFAVAESYPKLEASQNFMQLQEELSGTESKIAYSRQFYNDSVQEWNVKLQSFPSNLIGKLFGFIQKEFFKTESEEERKAVKVKF
ncbi:LemA family protein [Candidatus Woesearchaeota archaeon]|nr:LemA family protein [Candidatus Woesearchaeota archaeon]